MVKFKVFGSTVPRTRPVVVLGVCVGSLYRRTQVSLMNRNEFIYPMLLGRRFLFGYAVVNVAKKYTSTPHCRQMQPKK